MNHLNHFRGRSLPLVLASLALLCASGRIAFGAAVRTVSEAGFVSLFDGQSLKGWTYTGPAGGEYQVKDGVLVCPESSTGNLLTEREYSDFVLRFEFKLEAGGDNGIAIRAPIATNEDISLTGMEIQLLDDKSPKYAHLPPSSYNGSIWGIAPALNAAPKIGEWNTEEITCTGRIFRVSLNDKQILNTDLNKVYDNEILRTHPGMLRDRGHLGFISGKSHFEFRNIRIKETSVAEKENTPPAGFKAMFNGRDLSGWKGLVATPPKRDKMTPMQLAAEQVKADENMRAHWNVVNGELVFDGQGPNEVNNLCTDRDYGDFEMLADWKIPAHGDSGIFLRGSPQVQIWDAANRRPPAKPEGSGGLYNNRDKSLSHPSKLADKPVGEWNRMRILMIGEKVTVFLNGELVVNNITFDNYWEAAKPIPSTGQLELQNHGLGVWFKNLYIREIPRR